VDGAIEGVDGAGDDHRGESGVKLLGATDEFVAVHLRHDEVAEQKIERAGEGLLHVLERLLSAGGGDDAIASGLQQKGADREDLFVVVYTENRFLRAHSVSLLPEATLWWLRPMDQFGAPAGLQSHRSGVVQKPAPWFDPDVLRRVLGPLARRSV
jgi:hypothetical protein